MYSIVALQVSEGSPYAVTAVVSIEQRIAEPWPMYIQGHSDTVHAVSNRHLQLLLLVLACKISLMQAVVCLTIITVDSAVLLMLYSATLRMTRAPHAETLHDCAIALLHIDIRMAVDSFLACDNFVTCSFT
jgi:hypothetical protein